MIFLGFSSNFTHYMFRGMVHSDYSTSNNCYNNCIKNIPITINVMGNVHHNNIIKCTIPHSTMSLVCLPYS